MCIRDRCGPCRKEIPNLKKLYELYKGKGLEIVSVSIDKNETAWKKALAEEKLSWGLSFRYFGKTYANLQEALYFNGHWETFGGINFCLMKVPVLRT